jgi:cyclophilin family peptidyl-prolyl cis-trans isomerase
MICMNLFQPLAPVALFFSCLVAFPFQAAAQNAPVVLKAIPNTIVPKSGGSTTVSLSSVFGLGNLTGKLSGIPGPIARLAFGSGNVYIDIELFPEVAPATVTNFRSYITSHRYDNTIIHRSVPGFVIQGGGYPLASMLDIIFDHTPSHIEVDLPVKNEFQRSNTQGTIAMAKLGADGDDLNLDSATSEWFINMVDNNNDETTTPANLDQITQKFTVFGRIIGPGFQNALMINAPSGDIQPWNFSVLANPDDSFDPLWALSSLPLIDFDGDLNHLDYPMFVTLFTVREIPFIPSTGTTGGYLTLSATSSNTSLVKATISGTSLTLKSVGSGTGSATITVKAVDGYGQQVQKTFNVLVANTALPVVSIGLSNSTASEPGTDTGAFRVSRTGSTASSLTVKISGAGSTATNGTDFTAISTTVVIPAKAASKDILIAPKDDKIKEGPETLKLGIVSNPAYTVSPTAGVAVLTILDNDVPNVTVTCASPNTIEGTGTPSFVRFTRSGILSSPMTITFTLSGTATLGPDYLINTSYTSSGTITIPAGATNASLGILPQNDLLAEGIETVTVTAKASTAYNLITPSATLNIFEGMVNTVTVTAIDGLATEPGTNTGKFKFSRPESNAVPLTVFFTLSGTAKNGTDYTLTPNSTKSITIPAGSTFAYLNVMPKDDTSKEGPEIIEVVLKPSVYYNATPGTARVTINDND